MLKVGLAKNTPNIYLTTKKGKARKKADRAAKKKLSTLSSVYKNKRSYSNEHFNPQSSVATYKSFRKK